MNPYYQDIASIIPFKVDELIPKDILDTLPLNFNIERDKYVRKNIFSKNILNPNFVKWLESRIDMNIDKVVIWHWRVDHPNIAHIDCNPEGKIAPNAAINWTISTSPTSVQWFDTDNWELKISMQNDEFPDWDMPNVEAYIAVKVNSDNKDDEWNGRGPAIINTRIPHMIYAPKTRISVSLQFDQDFEYNYLINKLIKD